MRFLSDVWSSSKLLSDALDKLIYNKFVRDTCIGEVIYDAR